MKKTIVFIISLIFVVAIFVSCTPVDFEDTAITDAETEMNAKAIEDVYDINIDDTSEENFVAGFYLEGSPNRLLSVGSEVPKNSRLAYFNSDCEMENFRVHDGGQIMACRDWYGSGNTAFIVKEIGKYNGDPAIYLQSTKPEIVEGLYIIQSRRGDPAGKMLRVGMILYEYTEVAYLDKAENKKGFTVKDSTGKISFIHDNETYNTGGATWKIKSIQDTPDDRGSKAIIELVEP